MTRKCSIESNVINIDLQRMRRMSSLNFKYLCNRRNRNSRRRKKKANCKDSEDSDDGPRRGRCKSKFIRKIVLGELGFFYYPIRAPPLKFD